MSDTIIREISYFIEDQFPQIYKSEGKELIAFVKAYYEYLEKQENYSSLGRMSLDLMDIDRTLDDFVEHFSETYLKDFKKIPSVDKRFLIKNIMDYYHVKGTEQGLNLLMNLMFDDEATVYYPNQDILKASDSVWLKPFYLEVSITDKNRELVNREISGSISGAKAFVENIVRKRINSKIIDVLYLSSPRGKFQFGETITHDGNLIGYPTVVGSLNEIDIINGGRDLDIGDVFDVVSNEGIQGQAKVLETIDATGRVDFKIENEGWGYSLTDSTEILISDAVIFIDNPNEDFIMFEKIIQPIEEVSLISAGPTIQDPDLLGKTITGIAADSSIVGQGVVVNSSNFDGGVIIDGTKTDGVLSIEVSSGTFSDLTALELANSSMYSDGEIIQETSSYDIAMTNVLGNFTVGEWVKQIKVETEGSSDSFSGVLSTSSNEVDVGVSTSNIVVGQRFTKTGGSGVLDNNTFVLSVEGTIITLSKTPATSGLINFDMIPLEFPTSKFTGKVDGINGNVISLISCIGDVNTTDGILMEGESSSASGIPTSSVTIDIGAVGKVHSSNSTHLTISIDSGVFSVGNEVFGSVYPPLNQILDIESTGAVNVQVDNNTSVITSSLKRHVEGTLIGQNTSSIGVYSNNVPYILFDDFDTHIYTDRSRLVSPPLDNNGIVINKKDVIDRIAGGVGANFKISTLNNIEQGVPFYTDIIEDNNVTGIPYLDIILNGENSGMGIMSDLVINSGGSGYSNNDIITFLGGGFGGDTPIFPAEATINTDGSGSIISFNLNSTGSGYYNIPTIQLPNNGSGTDADIEIKMLFGYGFPKNPMGHYGTPIEDLLDMRIEDIGSIGILGSINPGNNYTADPYVFIYNKYVAPFKRYDAILHITNQDGSFMVGENLYQDINNATYFRGKVYSIESGKVYLTRQTFALDIDMNYPIYGASSGGKADVFFIEDDLSKPPIGLNGVISGEAASVSGVATKLEVVRSGFGYINDEVVTLEREGFPFVIEGTSKIITQGVSEGFWNTTTSHLNSNKVLQDNIYYQDYSYDILSGVTLNRYKETLKEIFHLAGTRMFGTFVKNSDINSNSEIVSGGVTYDSI